MDFAATYRITKAFSQCILIFVFTLVSLRAETIVEVGEIRPFFGPDDLNLNPERVVVAIDIYGDKDREVNGVLFKTDRSGIDNVNVIASNSIDGWASRPNYSGIDQRSADNLEEIMRDIRWEAAPTALEIEVSNLDPGIEYELQMLFNEGADRDRRWDIAIEKELVVDDFSSEGEGTWSSSNGFAYIAPFVLKDGDTELNVTMAKHLGGQQSQGADNNPILQAFTITELTIPATPESVEIDNPKFFAGQLQRVGRFVTVDLKRKANHLYSFVFGEGDTDNSKFEIEDGELFLSKDYDFTGHPALNQFSVRIRSTDAEDPVRFLDQIFLVQLADPKEPNDLLLSAGSISSGIIVDGLVGKLSVSDPNLFDQHLFSLVPGDGDKDNDLVYLRSSDLRLLSTISEGQSELKFRIRVTDMTGLSFEKSFNLLVTEPSIRINEFMASNGSVLEDDDGDASDWIELFNEQKGTLNLGGWFLSDDEDQLSKWRFPEVSIEPNGYLLVYASGKKRSSIGSSLHTNFEISSIGESLFLVKPDGETVADIIEFPEQRVDVSYGYDVAASETGYLIDPTPGQKNSDTAVNVSNEVVFSHGRGYYDEPVDLELSSTVPESVIRYTTNGAKPNDRSQIYIDPIRLTPASSSGKRGVRTVRAMAFNSSVASSPVSTHTYIWVNGTSDPQSTGVVGQSRFQSSIKNHPKYGPLINKGLLSLPAISITKPGGMSGSEGEANLELISIDGSETGFGIDCGMKIVGGASVGSAKNNFRCYFRSRYGSSKLRYPLFADHPYTSGASEIFDVIQLRSGSHDNFYWMANPGNPPGRKRQGDAQYVRNRWVSDMEMVMGHTSIHGRFVHCYLNGAYHGLYHVHERPMHNYLDKYFGGDSEDYHYTNSGRNGSNHGAGDDWNDTWREVKSAASTGGIKSRDWINWANLADNQLLYFYCGNDWDWTARHNWMAAGPKYPGRGGWRFYSWDCDVMLYDVEVNNLNLGAPDGIFSALMRDDEFRVFFKDRVYKHCFNDGVLSSNGPLPFHDYRMNEIYDAIIPETARWQPSSGRSLPWGRDEEWLEEWNYMKEVFWPDRTNILLDQFRQKGWYNVEAPEYEKIISSVNPGFTPVIISEDGEIYLTVDGSDPRLIGGTVNPDAFFINGATVDFNLISKESLWKYLDDGSDKEISWRLPGFDDSSWKEGVAELGYGDGREGAEGTILSYGDSGSSKHITTYFRKKFIVADAEELIGVKLAIRKDDGAVVYLNGVEVWRVGMPEGEINYETLATEGVGGSEETVFNIKEDIPIELFKEGENALAVEVHQVARTSSDISFDLELVATRPSDPSDFSIDKSTRLKARVLRDNEWSALNEVVYRVGERASASNFVVSELHYRPSQATEKEDPEGQYSRSDFEFLELTSISDQPIDFSGLNFSSGINFDFSQSDLLGLSPGESVIIVGNKEAFLTRYPEVDASKIIGEFTGNLDNDGERIEMKWEDGSIVRTFIYNDKDPWPEDADGKGYSLVLKKPFNNLDHSVPESWVSSKVLNGTPTLINEAKSFLEWSGLFFSQEEIMNDVAAQPESDPDQDGYINLVEYAFNSSPVEHSQNFDLNEISKILVGGQYYYSFSYNQRFDVESLKIELEVSSDMKNWNSGIDYFKKIGEKVDHESGKINKTFRSIQPIDSNFAMFFRLKIELE